MKKLVVSVLFFAVAALISLASLQGLQAQKQPISITESSQPAPQYTEELQTVFAAVPYQTRYFESAELSMGETRLLKRGNGGLVSQTVKVTYLDGVEVSRTVLSAQTVRPPTDALMLCGAEHRANVQTHPAEPLAENGVLTTPDGEVLTYTRVLSCTATAYSCEGYVGTTAIGTTARVGAIAVDPNYIPYGTKMYIVSDDGVYLYGYATAEDCGNFRGYHIDLYFNTVDECWTFGRRICTVYILE